MHKLFIYVLAATALLGTWSCQQKNGQTNEASHEDQAAIISGNPQAKSEQPQPEQATTGTPEKTATQDDAETKSEPFAYLEHMYPGTSKRVFAKYNKDMGEVLAIADLPKDHPLQKRTEFMRSQRFLKTRLTPNGAMYWVLYSSGPSADPTFYFFKDGAFDQTAFYLMTPKVYLLGNGSLYTSGHSNNMFNKRVKYQLVDGQPEEVPQPFYYVGLETKTLKAVDLYASQDLKQTIAHLPANYPIEVLLNGNKNNLYLIKTQFGLTGWVEVDAMRGRNTIEGLYFAGD